MKAATKELYKTALENLQAANRLLRRDRWVQHYLACDPDGREVRVNSSQAHAFCALGAVKFIDGPGEKSAVKILREAAVLELKNRDDAIASKLIQNNSIFRVNDKYGYDAVKSMFRRAIRIARKK